MTARPRVIAAVAAAVAIAASDRPSAGEDERAARCESRAQLAERIMRHRQDADDLEATWRMASLIRDPAQSRLAQSLVQAAYALPRALAGDERQQAAVAFGADVGAKCLAED
jgi:hypothetical protein